MSASCPPSPKAPAYTELTWDDKTETASFVKKGGYLGITLEAIDKDDIGRLRAAPRALAQAAWLTLSKAISGIFTEHHRRRSHLQRRHALFHSGHANLGTTALSMTSYNAARLAMRKQTELNSSERLGALTAPKYLLVPPDLEITALQILASEHDYTYALSNGTAAPANAFAEGADFQSRMKQRPQPRDRRRPVDRHQRLGRCRRPAPVPHHRPRLPLRTRPRDLQRRQPHRRPDVHQRHHARQGPLLLRRRSHGLARAV